MAPERWNLPILCFPKRDRQFVTSRNRVMPPEPSTGVSPSDNVSGSGWAITYGYSRSYRRNSSLGAAVDGASMGSAIAELFVSVAGEATAADGSTSGAMA